MATARLDLLRRMAVFGALNDETLQMLLADGHEVEVPADEYFFRAGDRAQSLFVLEEGTVAVERVWEGRLIVLGHLNPGDCLGEMSLIDMMPRSASVRAEEDCRAIEIPLKSLHRLYKQELEQYTMIMMNMGREVSRRLRKADERLFQLEQKIAEITS